jgi:hypothetical protein
VTVYAPRKTSALRTISQGVSGPDALAFDGQHKRVGSRIDLKCRSRTQVSFVVYAL